MSRHLSEPVDGDYIEKGDQYPGGPCAPVPGNCYLRIRRYSIIRVIDARSKPTVNYVDNDSKDLPRPDGKRYIYKCLRGMQATKFGKMQVLGNKYPTGAVHKVPPENIDMGPTIEYDPDAVDPDTLESIPPESVPLVQVKNNTRPGHCLCLSLNQACCWLHVRAKYVGTQQYPASPDDEFANISKEKVYVLQGSKELGQTAAKLNDDAERFFYLKREDDGTLTKIYQFPFYAPNVGVLMTTEVGFRREVFPWSWNPYDYQTYTIEPGFCDGCYVANASNNPRDGASGRLNDLFQQIKSDGEPQTLGDFIGLGTRVQFFHGLWNYYQDLVQINPTTPDNIKAIPVTYGPVMGLTCQLIADLHIGRNEVPTRASDYNDHVTFGQEPPFWFGG